MSVSTPSPIAEKRPAPPLPSSSSSQPPKAAGTPAQPAPTGANLELMLSGEGELELDLLPEAEDERALVTFTELSKGKTSEPQSSKPQLSKPQAPQRKFQARKRPSHSELRDARPASTLWGYGDVLRKTWSLYRAHLSTYLLATAMILLVLLPTLKLLNFILGLYVDPRLSVLSSTFPLGRVSNWSEAAKQWILHFVIPVFLHMTLLITLLCGLLRMTYDVLDGGKLRLSRLFWPFKRTHWIFIQTLGAYLLFLFFTSGLAYGLKKVLPANLSQNTVDRIGYAVLIVLVAFASRFFSFMYSELVYDKDSHALSAFAQGSAVLTGQYWRFSLVVISLATALALFFGFHYLVIVKLQWVTRSAGVRNLLIFETLLFGTMMPLLSIFWACLHKGMRANVLNEAENYR